MNLIEKLGIEKCKQIVGKAKKWSTHYRTDTKQVIACPNENHFYFQDLLKLGVEFIRIDDIRTAIVEHDQQQLQTEESKWKTIKVVCQRCGHYLNGCHCNHFGDQCPHLNTSMFGDNDLGECFNCNKIINKDREVVGDADDINLSS